MLGIALEDDHIALVRLQGHAKSYDVTLALRRRLPAGRRMRAAAGRAALRLEVVTELAAAHGLRGDTVLAALPAHRGALRNLALPFRDLRRLRQTIGFALDEHVPFEPERRGGRFPPPAGAPGAAGARRCWRRRCRNAT